MLNFKLMEYLADRGYLTRQTRIMDIGTQNILSIVEEPAIRFVKNLRTAPMTDEAVAEIRRLCHHSTPRPGERTAFLHELLELTDVRYDSIDIVNGYKTTIFDLNSDTPPAEWIGAFDLVINCGTLEHVINQYNALSMIHDILKVDGYWFDQPPSVGFLNHGYYNYNPLFYLDIATANDYELIEAWYTQSGRYTTLDNRFPVITMTEIDQPEVREAISKKPFTGQFDPGSGSDKSPAYNFNALMRKTADATFLLPLEIRTTHGPASAAARERYGKATFTGLSPK